jgi:predicted Zn-dependent protease
LYDNSVIAVTGDHGESLGAHKEETHGVFVYDETIHVPLLIKLPHGASAGKQVETRVELTDVMPTLLQAVAIEIPKEVQGQSLLELMKPGHQGEAAAEAWRDRGAYSQSEYSHLAYGWASLQSLRTGKYLYIQAPRRELYDQEADPKAEHNLAPESTAVADTLATRLEAFRQKTTNTREAPKANLDADRMRELAALGYVVSANPSAKAGALEEGVDPKDRIETVDKIRRLNEVLMEKRYTEALPVLEDLAAKFPDISMVEFKLGGVYFELKQYDKAVPPLRRAVEIEPLFTSAEMTLGKALYYTGSYDEAAKVFEALIARIPRFLDAQIFLELTYVKADRVEDVIRQCQRVLEMLPAHYATNLNLGLFLGKSGDFESAVPWLQKAAAIRPAEPLPHVYLSQVYDQLGRAADAEREKAEAIRLGAPPPDAAQAPDEDLGAPEQP